MQSHISRHQNTKSGDIPIDPLTEQSFHLDECEQPLMTNEFLHRPNLNSKDTRQPYQPFQQNYQDRGPIPDCIKEEINRVQSSNITKYSEKLFNSLFSQESARVPLSHRNDTQLLLSSLNTDTQIKSAKGSLQSSTLFERLNADYETVQYRKEQNEQVRESLEIEGCTFKPSLGVKTLNIAKVLSNKGSNSVLNSPPRYMSQKIKKIKESKKDDLKSVVQIHSKKTQYNKENLDKANVFERLNKIQYKVKSALPNFVLIQKNTSRQQSPDPIAQSQRLYEDAFKTKKTRIQAQPEPQPEKKNQKKQELLQMGHFIKEFFSSIKKAREWTLCNWEEQKDKIEFQFDVENDLCLTSIDEMVFVLNQLGFLPLTSYNIQDPKNKAIQIFKLLLCPQELGMILSRNFLIFLLAVQGLTIGVSLVPHYTNCHQIAFPKLYKNELFEFTDGNLDIEDSTYIQKKFQGYYLSHLSYYHKDQILQEDGNKQMSEVDRYHSEKTQKLASTFRDRQKSFVKNKETINLNDFQQIYTQRKQLICLEQKQKEIQQCSFKPIINKQSNKSQNTLLLRPQNQINDPKSINQISYEQQKDQCTFTPNISRSQSSHQPGNFVIQISNNDKKIVERMVKGRVLKKTNEMALSLGMSMNNKKRGQLENLVIEGEINRIKKCGDQNETSGLFSMFNTPNMQRSAEKASDQPFLFIDVNLDNGESSRIIVHEGDVCHELAQAFALKHNLGGQMSKKLSKLLDLQIQSVLST